MIIAVTGHRPSRLGGSRAWSMDEINRLALSLLRKTHPDYLMIGMALGWDTACANAAIELGIPFTAAVPFFGQDARWNADQRAHYDFLLSMASVVHYVSEGRYSAAKMLRRNEFMVDQSHAVLALWNGDQAGGTAYTVGYAVRTGKPVLNAWDDWMAFQERL